MSKTFSKKTKKYSENHHREAQSVFSFQYYIEVKFETFDVFSHALKFRAERPRTIHSGDDSNMFFQEV